MLKGQESFYFAPKGFLRSPRVSSFCTDVNRWQHLVKSHERCRSVAILTTIFTRGLADVEFNRTVNKRSQNYLGHRTLQTLHEIVLPTSWRGILDLKNYVDQLHFIHETTLNGTDITEMDYTVSSI